MPPAMGGISVSTARLRDRLIADGYDVDTYNLQMKVMPSCHALWQLLNTLYVPFYVLSKKKYDLIHFHISSYWRRVYLRLSLWMMKGAKTVVTVHGDVANYLSKPLSTKVLDAGDRIICVRPGNATLLPEKIRARACEIPAFIMPPKSEIDKMTLPVEVKSFVDKTKDEKMPLLVFNGALVTGKPFYDLYGFEDVASLADYLAEKNIKAALLVIVNDMNIADEKARLFERIAQRLSKHDNTLIVKLQQFSLLPIFSMENAIYIRPTKTDGDSLSVREALAMGAPVVASGNTPRPEGTICYDPADGPTAFFKAVEYSLAKLPHKNEASNNAYNDFYDKIIEVYDSLLK